jgi:hypothetical protein
MALKQGGRRAIERIAAAPTRAAAQTLVVADVRRRIETSNLLALKADVTVTDALDVRLDTAEADITAQEAADVALQAADTALDGRLTTAEADIIALEAADAALGARLDPVELTLPLKLEWTAVPASAAATGTAGQIAYESGFLYVCVAADTWQRVVIATWP